MTESFVVLRTRVAVADYFSIRGGFHRLGKVLFDSNGTSHLEVTVYISMYLNFDGNPAIFLR